MLKSKVFLKKQAKIQNVPEILGAIILASLATHSTMGGYLSFVNVSITALGESWGVFSFVSSLATYLATGNFAKGLVQITAMLMIICTKIILHKRLGVLSNSILTTATIIFSSVISNLSQRTALSLVVFRLVSSVLCGCIVYIATRIYENFKQAKQISLGGINGVYVSFIYIILIVTLCSVNVFSLNLGRTLGIIVVLLLCEKFGIAVAGLVGAITTFAVIMYSPQLGKNALILCVCVCLGSAFSKHGKLLITMSFVLVGIFGLVAVGFNNDTFSMLTDIAVASVFYVSLPKEIENKLFNIFTTQKLKNHSLYSAYNNINLSYQSINDIRTRLEGISKSLETTNVKTSVCQNVKNDLCKGCDGFLTCWATNKVFTTRKFVELEKSIKTHNFVSDVDFAFCKNGENLVEEFEKSLSRYACEVSSKEQSTMMRQLLIEQFSSTEELLKDLECNAMVCVRIDEDLSDKCSRVLVNYGFSVENVSVYRSKNNNRTVEIIVKKYSDADMIMLTVELGEVVGCELEMPVVNKIGNITRLTFCEYCHYKISTGLVQSACNNNDYCGDTVERIWLSPSRYMVILSDGMGTGKRARLDSAFATSIISKLVVAGVSPETALKMLNSIMRVKGWDESFATIDLALIDLCTGKVKFVKSGASPSFILRDGNLIKIEGEAFPIGIIPKISPYISSYKLFENDRIILTSDGVDETCVKKAKEEIYKNNLNPKQSSEIISEYSKEFCENSTKDDISVLVIEVFER